MISVVIYLLLILIDGYKDIVIDALMNGGEVN